MVENQIPVCLCCEVMMPELEEQVIRLKSDLAALREINKTLRIQLNDRIGAHVSNSTESLRRDS